MPSSLSLPASLAACSPPRDTKFVIRRDFSPDESALEIRMDAASCLGSRGTGLDSPGTDLFLTHGKKGEQFKQRIAGANHLGETGFFKPQFIQEFLPV